jgi:hypothetical protein
MLGQRYEIRFCEFAEASGENEVSRELVASTVLRTLTGARVVKVATA